MNDPDFWHVREASRVWGRPWQQLLELHDALPSKSWTLVGGLMVRIHAEHAGAHDSRTTRDVDAVLHLETGVITYPQAVHRLELLGYEHQEPVGDGPTHRLSRGNEHIDLMVADHLAPARRPRFRRRPVMAVPGASNTLRYHTVDCVIRREKDTDHRVVFSLPDTLGALSLKGGRLPQRQPRPAKTPRRWSRSPSHGRRPKGTARPYARPGCQTNPRPHQGDPGQADRPTIPARPSPTHRASGG